VAVPGIQYVIPWGQVETSVQDDIMPGWRDQILFSNPAYYKMRERLYRFQGGRSIVRGLSFSVEGGGGKWWSGVDPFDTTVRNPATAAVFYRKNYSLPIAIDRDEEDAVRGPEMVAELVGQKLGIARPTAIDAVGQALFNDGTNPKEIGGLAHMVRPTPGTSHTYGNITTSSTVNTWWQNQADNPGTAYVTGGTSNTFAAVRGFGPIGRMWIKVRRASGKDPTLILGNWGAFQDYHDSLAGTGSAAGYMMGGQRYMRQDDEMARAGFTNLMYRTAAWVADERAPHVVTSAGVTETEVLYFLHMPAIQLAVHAVRDMQFEAWRQAYDQHVRVAYINWSGELICTERRAQGVIANINVAATS
jgi:hypothetical protein